jgi:hypothetical protein
MHSQNMLVPALYTEQSKHRWLGLYKVTWVETLPLLPLRVPGAWKKGWRVLKTRCLPFLGLCRINNVPNGSDSKFCLHVHSISSNEQLWNLYLLSLLEKLVVYRWSCLIRAHGVGKDSNFPTLDSITLNKKLVLRNLCNTESYRRGRIKRTRERKK